MKKIAIVDCRMSESCRNTLEKFDFVIVETISNRFFDAPISAHPDIFMFNYKNSIILKEGSINAQKEHMFVLGDGGFEIIYEKAAEEEIRYPGDCSLNFAVCGDKIIGNFKYASKELLCAMDKYNLKCINVNQGYAKCNICVVSDDGIITEDSGIAKACINNKLDVLLLKEKSVLLNGYKNGFIGGSSGLYKNPNGNKILFSGYIEAHPEYDLINDFCIKHGAEPVSLSNEPLYDYGSIFIL